MVTRKRHVWTLLLLIITAAVHSPRPWPSLTNSAVPLWAATASSTKDVASPAGGSSLLLRKRGDQSYCSPSGRISDSCCDFETVEQINHRLSPALRQLVKTPFFKYYKVDLYKGCPFWQEDGFCTVRDCAVETMDEDDVPVNLRSAALSAATLPEQKDFYPFQRCQNTDVEFCELDDEDSLSGVYVNLVDNPERFTGYSGQSANRIWRSIYEENCFDLVSRRSEEFPAMSLFSTIGAAQSMPFSPFSPSLGKKNNLPSLIQRGIEDACLEKRVFYRIISGLHASISIHICHEYLNQTTGQWIKNLDCFIKRVSDHPERLENVYFDFVMLLRAVQKIAGYLRGYAFCNDLIPTAEGENRVKNNVLPLVDENTKKLVEEVLQTGMSCPSTFDEKVMFADPDSQALKEQFRNLFFNITRIMDCVSCEKCRLWGKVQTTGLGTALKILFADRDSDVTLFGTTDETTTRVYDESNPSAMGRTSDATPLTFQRTEIVALFNTLNRFSESIEAIETFRQMYRERTEEQKSKKIARSEL